MLDKAEEVPLATVTDLLDEVSTRLILDGVASICPADFERIAKTAVDCGLPQTGKTALGLAQTYAVQDTSIPERTRIASSGLVELRTLLQHETADSLATARSDDSAEKAFPTPQQDRAGNSLAADEDMVREFLTECSEHLAAIEGQLLVIGQGGCSLDTVNTIFRGFHTIKGLAGFLEFAEIQSLTHEVETLLDLGRNGQLAITPLVVDLVLESTDVVHKQLVSIQARLAGNPSLPLPLDQALLERLRHACVPAESAEASSPSASMEQGLIRPLAQPEIPTASVASPEQADIPIAQERRAGDPTSVRIHTAKLDQLMDTVGEMVIAQTLIQHHPLLRATVDPILQRNLTQLSRVTADAQRIATGMRMVPIGQQFQKTARLVRDLARRVNKQIEFESSGDDTELDKTIAEQLSDPLLHMVRNSIDHGIESADERLAAGKPPSARIRIAAFHQAGQVVVTVSDDGRGLDRNKILAKAQQNGLVAPGVTLSDAEIYPLIFEAGFSTAEAVTDISGRGVGMDVVRKHVQKLRGRIDIQSTPGQGTTFTIKLPLTLAIIEGLIVTVGTQRYVAPLFAVQEIFRATPDMLSTVHGKAEMVLVRSRLLPVVRLHSRLGIAPNTFDLTAGTMIVAESEGTLFCLFVDDLLGKQEVVIKSLDRRFKDVAGLAGCAILGDGRVGLILDLDGIFKARN
jgi:two-component system chemotaxis sensor kinase CheA